MTERLGLWLAKWIFWLTGNRELSAISQVLPLIPKRRLAIGLDALDRLEFPLLSGRQWYPWKPEADATLVDRRAE
jgi:hypothetical protein